MYFRVPRRRRLRSGFRIGINIVFLAMPLQITPSFDQLADEISGFHATSRRISFDFASDGMAWPLSSIMS